MVLIRLSVSTVFLSVKDYQLVQAHESSSRNDVESHEEQAVSLTSAHLSCYLKNFTSIVSHLLQVEVDSSAQDAVEATWVLSLALKGLYNTLKVFTRHLNSVCTHFPNTFWGHYINTQQVMSGHVFLFCRSMVWIKPRMPSKAPA